MKKYEFNGYKMWLLNDNKWDSYGKKQVRYVFMNPQKEIVFKGHDFYIPAHMESESMDTALALLSFLTLQDGDTDSEYFDKYTDKQLAFRDSVDCQNLMADFLLDR